MLTTEPTMEMIEEWKQIYDRHHSTMLPNRKCGKDVDEYFRSKYPFCIYDDPSFRHVVEANILENKHSLKKIEQGKMPEVHTYRVGEVYVGIDITSGEFHIECENIDKMIPIYDDLFVYRGLDSDDLTNYFLVAEYIKLSR